ncbi:hypothetical protein A2774_03365 [Candidatus Roizmanbacteria bacterium RIFCSPHIGHO2_01_FULL_39_12c]|uniref:GxxExxY protein n=1 Tax=Candidatus Roizmanbacteria bacterium RIFCSPHIGHO2_01_FULL_39_12c TaxID=1802031 RepID=A0A1F7G9A9_9BACT|nr:MAG: hypothetical protein A2774_03365 [Candidatus Roizmanbacteria bacterium RIFCSPHIGHO2_01_FULL_39_12c]OGK47857.1 MAG: hypothetical protein A2963_03320 [Candidatus Roizmanbacteria bacterium RIFCSPLOWO2_01_FULL_40_13]
MDKLIYPELSYKITGALFKTHNKLGKFCSEKQYCDFLEKCFKEKNINYIREKALPPLFIDEKPGRNKVDFLIENKIILEAKSKKIVTKDDYYQIKKYLTSLKLKLGILVNFRSAYLHPKRILNSAAKE